jgi:molecular chaperone HtpG
MEINPHHIIIKTLKERYVNDENSNTLKDLINLIFESSLIASGFNIEEPASFVNRINRMIKLGLSLDEDEEVALEKITEQKEEDNNYEEYDEEAKVETHMEDVD